MEKIIASGMAVHRGDGVVRVARGAAGVDIACACGHHARFDEVVMATHADQALRLLQTRPRRNRRY
ncbi:MAG: hypothetical protein U1E15_09535 [Hyphomicrobiales bacterium]